MSRAAERVMSIMSAVFTGLAIILGLIGLSELKAMLMDEALLLEFEEVIFSTDPSITVEDVNMIMSGLGILEGISIFLIILLVISLIATIIGIIFIWNNKKPKAAGIMFLVGGLFAYVISPTSILLYITAILCFTRKLPLGEEPALVDSPYTNEMRPL